MIEFFLPESFVHLAVSLVGVDNGSSESAFGSLDDAADTLGARIEFVQSVFSDSAFGDETSTCG